MTAGIDNLYARLHGHSSNCDEDFLTEGLAHLLRQLGLLESAAFSVALDQIVGTPTDSANWSASKTEILTQVATKHGIPDMVIKTEDFFAYIEVKVDSGFQETQLSRYRKALNEVEKRYTSTKLITLTRSKATGAQVDWQISWNEIGDLLLSLDLSNRVASFLRDQYVEFLTLRGVTMTKVTYELEAGIQALQSLLAMLEEALARLEVRCDSSTAGRTWHGYRISRGKDTRGAIFVGVHLDSPTRVWVYTEQCALPVDAECEQGKFKEGQWQITLDLSAEEQHFFARGKDSQLECLVDFLGKAVPEAISLLDRYYPTGN